MKIYTKTGDSGQTGLIGGERVSKAHTRIEAYGTVDELNSFVGQCRAMVSSEMDDAWLERIQHELFAIGAALATPSAATPPQSVGDREIARLETQIDETEAQLPPLKHFIFPGGTALAAALHICRSVCRRAERRVVELMGSPGEAVPEGLVIYLNRLSDLFFVLARAANQASGTADRVWRGEKGDQ